MSTGLIPSHASSKMAWLSCKSAHSVIRPVQFGQQSLSSILRFYRLEEPLSQEGTLLGCGKRSGATQRPWGSTPHRRGFSLPSPYGRDFGSDLF